MFVRLRRTRPTRTGMPSGTQGSFGATSGLNASIVKRPVGAAVLPCRHRLGVPERRANAASGPGRREQPPRHVLRKRRVGVGLAADAVGRAQKPLSKCVAAESHGVDELMYGGAK